ncbi:MAG TPA: c-type cytochrome [Kofleriaceae bacterium]|nr:c-type cytochrome [Kofleriaceae bacterium]
MRRIAIAVAVALAGCAAPAGTPSGVPYLDDRGYRRSQLEASLVDPQNGYSQLRLEEYALPSGGWDALPEWNPNAMALDVDPSDDAALQALGEQAFFGYPVEIVPAQVGPAYGTWSDPTYGAGGLVAIDGGAIALSCASCHASLRGGALVPGLGNERFDLGKLLVDGGTVASENAPAYLAWGPGRVDVTTLQGSEPVRIPDLRAARWLGFLQADADVAQLDRDVLAIRLETLMITSHDELTRPPRIVALALASYLWSLADTLPALPPDSARGAAVFAASCSGCHQAPALTGPPVALDVIGTDPTLGRSAVRGTGAYRVPSLHGVAQRALLLHDGSLASLDALFDPARTDASYTGGVRAGAVPGHLYGLDLSSSDRADLLAYLEAL